MQSEPHAQAESDTLPVGALVLLALTGFTAIVTETLPAGLLPQVADDLSISRALAGQMVTVYAVGSVVAAIPLVSFTQSYARKPLLLAAIVGLLVFDVVTALSHSYAMTLVARFAAGVAAGLGWGILGGYARRLVIDRLKGRALALAMIGTPLALSVGVPLGTFAGGVIGWRTAFLVLAAQALCLAGAVAWKMPDSAGQPRERKLSNLTVLRMPGVAMILATAFAWVTAHYILYTYVAPYAEWAGDGDRVSLLLLVFGCAALAGIWIAGAAVDGHLRLHVLASLAVFAGATAVLGFLPHTEGVILVGVIFWGLTFGGAATSVQTAASDAAGEGVDIVGAMLTTVWNVSIACGGAIGALIYRSVGIQAFFPTMLVLLSAGFVVAYASSASGFRPGARTAR
ncbi:MFS transporter [Sphingomonas sp. 2R-10]|uniref:MFS transporter n=1 Tax=Sphingomonas sp. 2R-10 TaxID=3045148 RepID=UPI001F49A2CC|nr:MFS transporter [Sphingomonas sp. 2R-10]MDJ0276225.1 MFS transporter [Sphingomonas sp. 2R-10]